MTFLTTDLEHEARNWSPVDPKAERPGGLLVVGRGAIAEIKPHTSTGQRAGLDQLFRYRFGTKDRPARFPAAPQW